MAEKSPRRVMLEQSLAEDPNDTFLRYGLAVQCLREGDVDEGRERLHRPDRRPSRRPGRGLPAARPVVPGGGRGTSLAIAMLRGWDREGPGPGRLARGGRDGRLAGSPVEPDCHGRPDPIAHRVPEPDGAAMSAIFTFPNRILFGAGARRSLAEELARLRVSRPLVVTDRGLDGVGARRRRSSETRRRASSSTRSRPTRPRRTSWPGSTAIEPQRCDGLIGLGGGSPIDAAKAIRLLVTHPGRLADYDLTTGGLDRIRPDLPPMVAIPTTAGTGSEAGRGALIQLPQTGRKTIVLSPHLLPSVAICDPELTRGLPPVLTAGTGMDAFTHCVESYLSTTLHPICDGIALEGLRHISQGLEAAVRDGSNAEAREAMMMGALLGGISFHKGLGVVHSLSHALGSEGRVHHGTLNAILLPHALRFNREAALPRLAELAARLGLGRGGEGPAHLITLTELVLARLPLPRRLRRASTASATTGSPSMPAWPCSITATGPTRAPAPRPTWSSCSTGPGEPSPWTCAVFDPYCGGRSSHPEQKKGLRTARSAAPRILGLGRPRLAPFSFLVRIRSPWRIAPCPSFSRLRLFFSKSMAWSAAFTTTRPCPPSRNPARVEWAFDERYSTLGRPAVL